MERNEELRRQFVREVRIGLSLIAVTVMVFAGVIYTRISGRYQRDVASQPTTASPQSTVSSAPTASVPPAANNGSALQAAILPMIDRVDPHAGETSPTKAPPMPVPRIIQPSNPSDNSPATTPDAQGNPTARITRDEAAPVEGAKESNSIARTTQSISRPAPFELPRPVSPSSTQPFALPPVPDSAEPIAQTSFEATADVETESGGIPREVHSRPLRAVRFAAGDSLWKIAQKHYGDGRWFRALAAFNQLDRMPPGQKLVGLDVQLPDTEVLIREFGALVPRELRSAVAPDDESAVGAVDAQTHITVDKETLFMIARDRLGQASRYLEILRLNQDLLPPETTAGTPLPAGIRLALPKE